MSVAYQEFLDWWLQEWESGNADTAFEDLNLTPEQRAYLLSKNPGLATTPNQAPAPTTEIFDNISPELPESVADTPVYNDSGTPFPGPNPGDFTENLFEHLPLPGEIAISEALPPSFGEWLLGLPLTEDAPQWMQDMGPGVDVNANIEQAIEAWEAGGEQDEWVTDDPMLPGIETPVEEDEEFIDDVLEEDLDIEDDEDDGFFDDIFGGIIGGIFSGREDGSDESQSDVVIPERPAVDPPPVYDAGDSAEPDFDPPAPIDDSGEWQWDPSLGDYAWIFIGEGENGGSQTADPNNPSDPTEPSDPPPEDDGANIPSPPIVIGEGDDDDFNFPFPPIFGGGDDDEPTTGDNVSFTNTIGDFLSETINNFDFADLLNQTINLGVSEYAADQFGESLGDQLQQNWNIYQQGVNRLDPYNQLGLDNISATHGAANTNPDLSDPTAGQHTVNPNTNFSAPGASQVDVNQVDLLDPNNPYLKAMQDESVRQIRDSGVMRGKFHSGDTLKALNDSTMANYATMLPALQSTLTQRDNLNLAADNQYFGQGMAGATFDLNQGQSNIDNVMALNNMLYGQAYDVNNQNLYEDQQAFNQLNQLVGGGQSAAAGQGGYGGALMSANSPFQQAQAANQGYQYQNYAAMLADLFGV